MLPLVGIPATIEKWLKSYRQVFGKEAGFQHINRYISGLLMSSNKTAARGHGQAPDLKSGEPVTLQGIYNQIVWSEGKQTSRRGMHEAVFEAGWKHQELMAQHRRILAPIHKGIGREVIALDWTFSYHPYSQKIWGSKEAYDYVNRCWSHSFT